MVRTLCVTLLFIFCFPLMVGGQEKKEEVISIQVRPRAVVPNPYKRVTFHIIWRIARHPDNRHWTLAYACTSGESHGSGKSMDGENEPITYDVYREVLVGGGCNFEVCVYRGVGKPFRCARETVAVPEEVEP